MQIVIDINELDFEVIKEVNELGGEWKTDIAGKCMKAIANGTPLPKNHGDLIDANRKITVPTYDVQYEEWGEETLMICEALNKWSDEGVTIDDIVIPADDVERKIDEKENK